MTNCIVVGVIILFVVLIILASLYASNIIGFTAGNTMSSESCPTCDCSDSESCPTCDCSDSESCPACDSCCDCPTSGSNQMLNNPDFIQIGVGNGSPGFRLGGEPMRFSDMSLDKCSETCIDSPGCEGINYIGSERRCNIMTNPDGAHPLTMKFLPNSDYTSYVKRTKNSDGQYNPTPWYPKRFWNEGDLGEYATCSSSS